MKIQIPVDPNAEGARELDAKIAKALLAVNGKARSFAITNAWEIRKIAARAEAELEAKKLRKKYRVGARVIYEPAGPQKAAYKYSSPSTHVELYRGTHGWFLVSAERCLAWPTIGEVFKIEVSPAAFAIASANALGPIHMKKEKIDEQSV